MCGGYRPGALEEEQERRRVERIDERFWGRGHRGFLPCVHRRPPFERSLTALANSTKAPSPVVLTIRPRCDRRCPLWVKSGHQTDRYCML